jgi:hypothetical protein
MLKSDRRGHEIRIEFNQAMHSRVGQFDGLEAAL